VNNEYRRAYGLSLRRIVFCLMLVIGWSFADAQDADALFKQGNDAFTANNYSEAITKYEAVLTQGLHSDELHYNLGNAYYKSKQLGKAVFHFELALLHAPGNKDARFNLETVNAQLKDEISVLPTFFLTRWWRGLRGFFSSTMWSVLCLLALWLFVAGIAGWLLYTDRSKKKRAFLGAGLGLVLSVLLFVLAWQRWSLELDTGHGIVLEAVRPLHSAPDGESAEILTLHEGTKVELTGMLGDWHKVRLVNGEVGWLPKAGVGVVRL